MSTIHASQMVPDDSDFQHGVMLSWILEYACKYNHRTLFSGDGPQSMHSKHPLNLALTMPTHTRQPSAMTRESSRLILKLLSAPSCTTCWTMWRTWWTRTGMTPWRTASLGCVMSYVTHRPTQNFTHTHTHTHTCADQSRARKIQSHSHRTFHPHFTPVLSCLIVSSGPLMVSWMVYRCVDYAVETCSV